MLSTLRGKILLGLLAGQGASAPAPTDVPANLSLPSISSDGDPVTPGDHLITDVGGWSQSPTSYTIDLYDAEYALVAADAGIDYVVLAGDAGKVIHPVVTATNVLGDSIPTSSLTETAPAISSAVPTLGVEVAGDDGLFAGTPGAVTYQWQKNTGSWADIAGATSKNYTPLDADNVWGATLRLARIPTVGDTLYSNATGAVQEVPVSALGATLVTNGDFAAWTTDNPNGWTITGESGSDPMITEVAADGSAGTGAARLVASATFERPLVRQTILTIGNWYEIGGTCGARTSGNPCVRSASSNTLRANRSSAGVLLAIGRATHATFECVNYNASAGDFVLDDVFAKLITPNTELVAPSANMQVSVFYTLPGSPASQTRVLLLARIDDFAAGNYLVCDLNWTGTQWNMTFSKVSGHTLTGLATSTNVGTTNGIQLNLNGDSLKMYSTANAGGLWTQRGATATDSTHLAETGVNALATSDVTGLSMTYAAAA